MTIIRSKNGFTVLELIIVITIVGIMVTIATLALGDYWRRSTVKEAARLIDGDLMDIRTVVRDRQQAARMTVTPNGYTAFLDVDGNTVFNAGAGDQMLYARTFNASLQIQGVGGFAIPPGTIAFDNLGRITTTAQTQFIISMTTEPARQFRVSISTTGLIRIDRSEDSGANWAQAW